MNNNLIIMNKKIFMSLSDRLEILINENYSSRRDFAKKVGVNNNTINNIINNKNSPNHSIIYQILKSIPKLSAEWLIRGEGAMWKEVNINPKENEESSNDKDTMDLTLKEIVELIDKQRRK